MLLACQAHFPSLHPSPCDIVNHPSECTTVSGRNLSLLTLGLYVIPIGEGAVRVCAAALGGDQFDGDDPRELRGKASFFNWYAFCISLGGFVGLVFVVWVQNNEGWDLGFVLSALVALLGTLVLVAGLPFYRHQKPTGSPLTTILQVRAVLSYGNVYSTTDCFSSSHQPNFSHTLTLSYNYIYTVLLLYLQ